MSGNGHLFRVSMSGLIVQEIKALAEIATSMGQRAAFLTALEAIYHHLRNNPREFGEHRFSTGKQKLYFRIGALRPVAVHFAVHENLPIVLVAKVFLMGA